MAVTGAPVIVYKTRMDVGDAVPINLSADGGTVTSYPHPADLRTADGYALPVPLGQGYLLDQRGVGVQTAFLSMSYETYAALPKVPSMAELLNLVQYRDPMAELYDCGKRNEYVDIQQELAALIGTGQLRKRCKQLK